MLVHRGIRTQSGRGIGSIFSALARGLAPIAKLGLRAGKSFFSSPMVQKVGKSALDLAKQSAVNLTADLIQGNNMEESAQKELNNARQKIASTLRGGRKRKKHEKPKNKPKGVSKKKVVRYNLLD